MPVAALTALQGLRDKGGLQPGPARPDQRGIGRRGHVRRADRQGARRERDGRLQHRERRAVADRWAPIASSTTPGRTSRGARSATTSCSTSPEAGRGRSAGASSSRRRPSSSSVVRRQTACSGPIGHVAGMRLGAMRGSRKVVFFVAKFNKPDMEVLRELLEVREADVGDRPDATRSSEIADAMRYLGEGHASGKIVITIVIAD